MCEQLFFGGYHLPHRLIRKADYSDRSFVTRMDNLGCPDIILIFGGTNDSWAGAPIGEYQYADWTKQDLYSFRPAMAYMLEHIRYRYPNVEVYFLLNCDLKEEINESVKTICAHYQVPCIELKGIDKQSSHPSVKGMQQINEQLKAYFAGLAIMSQKRPDESRQAVSVNNPSISFSSLSFTSSIGTSRFSSACSEVTPLSMNPQGWM